ncbi:ATP-binding protein [Flagellimonas sp. HMM57]|uniref:hybrid sensor histidine kinase/response regulator transcription factor n=1 Tax=unclassified Flagellimonas TaxID=2644544 RepID=UPI0013D37AFE|nr:MULTISPECIES: hybrid sensor histidine kinase/response regulator transcription factor [unclassified Flagellimonas]UII77294.1 ATP-binding protein [Flagellimonas sp. HMM57]
MHLLFQFCERLYRKELISILFLCFIGNSQNIKFEHYNDNDGLSHNSVRHITQDNNGFLWLGTFSGLNRFDGYQFKPYLSSVTNTYGLNNDDITALEFDSDSNELWIGTRNGLTHLNLERHSFRTFLPEAGNPDSLGDSEIRSVLVDSKKRVWVGTKTRGLYRYSRIEDSFIKIDIDGFKYVKEIFEDHEGNIWVGTYGKKSVARIVLNSDGNSNQIFQYTLATAGLEEQNPYLNFIYQDHKSDIFIGTRNGLYKLDKEENVFKDLYIQDRGVREQLGPHFISVARSPEGQYWVGTLGGLLTCNQLEDVADGNFDWHYTILSDDSSVVDNLVYALYFDTSGVLWIGTEDGLDKYDPYKNQFKLNKSISLHIDNQVPRIRGFSKTYDDKVIVATRHNGLFIMYEDGILPLFDKKYDIASIYSEDGKVFYCGLWDGRILVYDYVNNTGRDVDLGFQSSSVLTFSKYSNTAMIAGSFEGGALLFDKKTLTPIQDMGRLLPGRSINKIVVENNNKKVWFATEDGVASLDLITNNITNYRASTNYPEGLPHDNVSDIIIDTQNNLWAATRLGLSYYNSKEDVFEKFDGPLELSGKWITDMLIDANDMLWLNMNNSIAKLDTQDNEVSVYNTNSGNRLDVFSSSGFYHVPGSDIFLGGKNGVIHFSPYNLKENQWSPKPFVTEFKVQNKVVHPGVEINKQKFDIQDLNYGKKVDLNYNNRNFSLQFSNPSFSNERLNKYEYMLEGFDEDWISVGSNSRTVQYTNLYPDKYTFKLRSSNSNGYWSDLATYDVTIKSPFWLTPEALLITFFVLLIVFFVVRRELKNKSRLRQALLFEKIKQERIEKLNNEKFRFFTNISHELRTPLTLILGPAKDLVKKSTEIQNHFLESRSQLIHQNANRLLNLVNQILDFRKAQTGELSLKVSQIDILQQCQDIFDSFKDWAISKNISFNFNCEYDIITGWIDKDKLDKILYNLLSNAIKFTDSNGSVDLFVGFADDSKKHLLLEVSDNGIGIPQSAQKNIFSRFYQARNSKDSTTGSGIGLSLVKSLVEVHKGTILLQSEPNKGSIFTVKLPIKRKYFDDSEIRNISVKGSSIKTLGKTAHKKKIVQSTHIKEKILIIEDNIELRNYIEEYLSEYYKVYCAEDGEEGLLMCRKIMPILCVADIMMPVMDGLQFCEELKQDQAISHIPVILLTARSENEDKVQGYNVGADGYMVKPFDPALLKTRIVNIINSRKELKAKFSGEVDSEISLLTHSPIDEEFMKRITRLIDEKIGEADLTTSLLCQELGMSSSKLYRKIKELTDLAPNEFIRTIRLKQAAVLLKSRRYNVSEVSVLVGFNDPLYFSRCFKKQFGYPPSQLIKNSVQAKSL